MKIQVRCRGFEDHSELQERARSRAGAHLDGFGPELISAVVRVDDINGPRGGVDKRCRVTVKGPRVGTLNATHDHLEAGAAVELALQRVAHAVRRKLDRLRERQTRRGVPSTKGAVRSPLAAAIALAGLIVVSLAGCATVPPRQAATPTKVHACGPAQRASASVEVSRSLPVASSEEHGVFDSDRLGLLAYRMAVRCGGPDEQLPAALPLTGL